MLQSALIIVNDIDSFLGESYSAIWIISVSEVQNSTRLHVAHNYCLRKKNVLTFVQLSQGHIGCYQAL